MLRRTFGSRGIGSRLLRRCGRLPVGSGSGSRGPVSIMGANRRLSLSGRPGASADSPAGVSVNPSLASLDLKGIEAKWKPRILAEWRARFRERPSSSPRRPFYVLSMFPYPSGALHMGHVRVYSISDVMAHYHRFQGLDVLHPMGWDAFGLPAENAARQHRIQPQDWTRQNIASMKDQLMQLGLNFDWDREVATCDPRYYRWTQWIFLQLLARDLVYQEEALVNWDPVDRTVLADEQVDENGRSWRSGALVEKRPLKQWFVRCTQYAQSLLDGLDKSELTDWRDVLAMQRSWIGPCNGTKLKFGLTGSNCESTSSNLWVWTDRPELIWGAAFVAITPEHILAKTHAGSNLPEIQTDHGTVHRLPFQAINPMDPTHSLPILLFRNTDIFTFETDHFLGIPEICPISRCMADTLEIPTTPVLNADQTTLINSSQFSGQSLANAKTSILELARSRNLGGYAVSSRLKDWLISRQRYWGTPIPIIHCEQCGAVPVPVEELPVVLPEFDALALAEPGEFGDSPLAQAQEWLEDVKCPKCGSDHARRETDTMDTFVDSAWYFLRYLDPKNDKEICGKDAAQGLPVDVYIGGKEHATLHLYFARFITHFLHDLGISPVKEPFKKLIVQGMVKSKTYKTKAEGRFLHESEVDLTQEPMVEKVTGEEVILYWDKMSKSKFNGVDPKHVVDKYGCDTTRLMMLAEASPTSERLWSEDSFTSINQLQIRFLKLVSLAQSVHTEELKGSVSSEEFKKHEERLISSRNYHVSGTNFAYGVTSNLRFVVHKVQSLLKDLWVTPNVVKRDCDEFQRCLATAIILMTPMSPHFCAELWEGLSQVEVKRCLNFRWDRTVFHQDWPQMDKDWQLKLGIEFKEKSIDTIPLSIERLNGLTHDDALKLVQESPSFREIFGDNPILSELLVEKDHRAVLTVQFDMKNMSPAQRKALREQEKLEKRLKRERRQEKIRELQANEAKKTVMPIAKTQNKK